MLTKPIPPMTPKQEERFWNKVEVHQPSACWEWTAAKQTQGYGSIGINNQHYSAHRVAYTLLIGPITPEMHIDHLCRNRNCVNPDHMQVVTTYTNNIRGYSPAGINARKTHCIKGHELTGSNLLNHKLPKRCCRRCHYDDNLRRKKKRAAIRKANSI